MSIAANSSKRVFFYVQHLLGIGHLVRASRVAEALRDAGLEVTMLTGGGQIDGFPGPGISHIQLPAVFASNSGFSGLADAAGNAVDEAFQKSRAERLVAAFHDVKPHAVIIEAFPFGRRQMRFELLPLLDAIARSPEKPALFSSVRDILQENRKAGRDEETAALIEQHFDGVLVHGDSDFVALEETFPLAARIADKVYYTGLVAPKPPEPTTDRFDVVVSAGGGAVGAPLIRAALAARTLLQDTHSWCVITGPNLPQAEFDDLSRTVPPEVQLVRFRKDFPNLLMNARLSISQAGYNTVGDLLRARCANVLIPFASGGETEQTVRAHKLSAMGLAEIVSEAELSPENMANAVRRALSRPRADNPVASLEGARKTAEILLEFMR